MNDELSYHHSYHCSYKNLNVDCRLMSIALTSYTYLSLLSLTLFSYNMFLAKYYLDVSLDLFGFNSLRIYSSVMFERHISKNTGLFRNFLTLISVGLKLIVTVPLVLWWQVALKAAHGRLRTHRFDHWVCLWQVVHVIPIPKDQDNPWRFSFYNLFTDITYKFEYRATIVQTAWFKVRLSSSLPV